MTLIARYAYVIWQPPGPPEAIIEKETSDLLNYIGHQENPPVDFSAAQCRVVIRAIDHLADLEFVSMALYDYLQEHDARGYIIGRRWVELADPRFSKAQAAWAYKK